MPDESQKLMITNRYRNSIAYLDSLLSELLAKVGESKRPTILLLSGDHGEEFWEFGFLGHGKASFVNPRVRVPLVWCELNRKEIDSWKLPTLTFHQDLMPLLLQRL